MSNNEQPVIPFSVIIPFIVPFLSLKETVRLSTTSPSVLRGIHETKSFWDHLDFSCNSFAFCLPQLRAFLSSHLSRQGQLVRGLSFAFSQDFDDSGLSILPIDQIETVSPQNDFDASSEIPIIASQSDDRPKRLISGLHSLNLNSCEKISDFGLITLSKQSQHLEVFESYYNIQITDQGIIPLIQSNCRSLTKLNLSG